MENYFRQVIEKNKIIVIIRNLVGDNCIKLAEALYKGGIRMIEVAFNPMAPDSFYQTAQDISSINKHFGQEVMVGAGTVISAELVSIAYNAGALYIISPDVNPDVISATKKYGIISIPGALTPSEISFAYRCGADLVKLFPAVSMGVEYIRAIGSPLGHIPLLATGGINGNNIQDYLNAGCIGVGIGNNLANKKLALSGGFDEITSQAKEYVSMIK